MKKISLIIASLAITATSFAQNIGGENPNRLIITNTAGNYSGYVIDHTDNISFATVEGEVKATVSVSDVALDKIKLSVTRSEACEGFRIAIIPNTIAGQLTDDVIAIGYLKRDASEIYYQDFTDAELTGIDLDADSEYAIYTIAVDRYGVEASTDKTVIKTPAPEIVGDPKVTAEVIDRQLKSFKIKFTPNDDVTAYYCVAGEKGTMQSQYEMFGPMFGFSNFNQMIMSWGIRNEGVQEKEWKDFAPNSEYEVYVVSLDINGNPAPYQVFEVSTLALGGDGEATVTITLGDYKLTNWNDEQLPSQFITFTPNDQASCFRVGVYKAEIYDEKADEIKAELCTDPMMPTAYWFFYETLTTDYQINPNVDAVAIAAAKNGNNEWGEVTELRFTTPAEVQGAASVKKIGSKIMSRAIAEKKNPVHRAGYIPMLQKRLNITVK